MPNNSNIIPLNTNSEDYNEYEMLIQNQMKEVGYIVDYDTHQLIYFNNAYKIKNNITEQDYLGKTCHEFIYDLEAPCKNCRKKTLELDKEKQWHKYSNGDEAHFIVQDKMIDLNGKRVIVQTAYDITNQIEEIKDLQQTITYDKAIIECCKTLLDETPFEFSINKLLKILCDFYGSDSACVFERNYDKGVSNVTFEYHNNKDAKPFIGDENMEALIVSTADDWTKLLLEKDYIFMNVDDINYKRLIQGTNYQVRFSNSKNNNLLVAPLNYYKKILGAIEISNLTKNLDNLELIKTVSAFVVNNLNSKNQNESLKKSVRYHENSFIAMQNLSDDILFKINLKHKLLVHQEEKAKSLGIPTKIDDFPDSVPEHGAIHPDDLADYMEYARAMCRGECGMIRVRFKSEKDNISHYEYFEITSTPLYDDIGNPVEIVGKLKSVQKEMEMEKRATVDNLTSAFNKISFEEVVTKTFSTSIEDEKHALFFIDLDDFKFVNDNYGHAFGDFLLKTIGKRLNMSLHENDIIGRVGGDEFVVLLKNIEDTASISSVAQRILERLNEVIVQGDISHNIKCSIGVAIYPTDADNYNKIYDCADKALYVSKNKGKNVYTFYSDL